MDSALLIHRLQFAFTVTYHYLFPQLTMGLAPLIVILKTLALKTNDPSYDRAARFWAKIFGINFVIGVVTGIPMEFQFGTNWSHFSRFAGGVIGQTLAMEGCFAFFMESAFLGLFLYGEKRLSKGMHWFAALMVFLGSWLSGYFIVATDAWMQNPVGYERTADGSFQLTSFWQLVLNPWAWLQYAHNMSGAVITGAFVMSAVGAFYLLSQKHVEQGRIFVRLGVIAALIVSVLQLFPTGDWAGRMVARKQPVTLAAMEALWETQPGAPLVILGQPNVAEQKIDNPIVVPKALSFLTWRRWNAEVQGLNHVPREDWRDQLYDARWMLWILLLLAPFPYIANTAGWMSAELGRQPWLIYGLLRTADGYSKMVSAGNGWFTLLGFMGMYTLLSMLFLFLVAREIQHGPEPAQEDFPAEVR